MKLATKGRIDRVTALVSNKIASEMDGDPYDGLPPPWATDVINTVYTEVQSHVRAGVKYGLEELDKEFKRETGDLQARIKELEKKLSRYEHIERAIQEADKK